MGTRQAITKGNGSLESGSKRISIKEVNMPGQEELNRNGQQYIADLRAAARDLWAKMCEEDKIPPDSKFVVFSETNKYKPFYDKAITQIFEAEKEYQNGGYVGLVIKNGRAELGKKKKKTRR
jgi:hypothetical protein